MSAHVLDRLSLYLDGELAAGARAEVEAHLRGCAACARHLEELAAVDAAARELPVPAPPGYFDSLPARVRARLPAPRRRTPPVWVWAAAAGLALAALAPLLLRQTRSPVGGAARSDEDARFAPPPSTAAPEAPGAVTAEAERVGGARDKLASKDAARTMAAPPPPTPPPALYGRDAENAAGAPAPPPPPASAQIQKHKGPWAQAPAGAQASAASQAPPAAPAAPRAEGPQAEEALARAPKEAAQGEVAPEAKAERELARRGLTDAAALAQTSDEARFRTLVAQRPASAGQARQLHDAWTAFAAAYPSSPRADEARVRAIEALALAWDKGGDPTDQEGARQAALDYLAARRAPQRARVRALLDHLAPPRP